MFFRLQADALVDSEGMVEIAFAAIVRLSVGAFRAVAYLLAPEKIAGDNCCCQRRVLPVAVGIFPERTRLTAGGHYRQFGDGNRLVFTHWKPRF